MQTFWRVYDKNSLGRCFVCEVDCCRPMRVLLSTLQGLGIVALIVVCGGAENLKTLKNRLLK